MAIWRFVVVGGVQTDVEAPRQLALRDGQETPVWLETPARHPHPPHRAVPAPAPRGGRGAVQVKCDSPGLLEPRRPSPIWPLAPASQVGNCSPVPLEPHWDPPHTCIQATHLLRGYARDNQCDGQHAAFKESTEFVPASNVEAVCFVGAVPLGFRWIFVVLICPAFVPQHHAPHGRRTGG